MAHKMRTVCKYLKSHRTLQVFRPDLQGQLEALIFQVGAGGYVASSLAVLHQVCIPGPEVYIYIYIYICSFRHLYS